MGLKSISASEDVIGDLPSPGATINSLQLATTCHNEMRDSVCTPGALGGADEVSDGARPTELHDKPELVILA